MIFKKILPVSLLGRSIIIIFVPIFLLVIITSVIFYQTSWNIISKRLTESVVADINVIVKLIKQDLKTEAIEIAKKDFKMKINIQKIDNKSSKISVNTNYTYSTQHALGYYDPKLNQTYSFVSGGYQTIDVINPIK